jgi:hypothetical protein
MLRFTIRELLILTVTAGLAVGWWLEHRRANRFQGDSAYLRLAIDRAGYIPGGDFAGPNLSRKELD